MEHIKITLVMRGETQADVDDAFEEAVKSIREGNVSGGSIGDKGGFYFDVTQDVSIDERAH